MASPPNSNDSGIFTAGPTSVINNRDKLLLVVLVAVLGGGGGTLSNALGLGTQQDMSGYVKKEDLGKYMTREVTQLHLNGFERRLGNIESDVKEVLRRLPNNNNGRSM